MFLQCSNNNRANTVFELFHDALILHELPTRVRTDKGRENCDIAWYMLNHPLRGPERASHITGRSVHNQRIERLWRDVFRGCTYLFYNMFYDMESQGILDPYNELHPFALHCVFLPRINRDLSNFTAGFNNSPIRTEHNQSPNEIWIRGLLEDKGPAFNEPVPEVSN